MDVKQAVTEVGMQVASSPTCCIVDAVSSIGHTDLCPEAIELLEENKLDKQDGVEINLEQTTLCENPSLDRSLKDNFICPICQGLLVRTRVLGCGHHFCRECLHRWIKLRRMCPMCRQSVATCVTSLFIDTFLDDVIDLCGKDELKQQRWQRKKEQESLDLDEVIMTRVPTEMATMMISNYAQTISSYSQSVINNSAANITDNWTQASTTGQVTRD
ncbi:hypothetical protein FGIG_11721 [Fasciola gigantica]|uniref:RING-type domain-containing protein n=1 Tax=Fasciola gigantica TaxID=46835 RepID=A0A504YDL5_FASGI|nr:hypothetical protein FGIG_11721 [Fasciola gigantica]